MVKMMYDSRRFTLKELLGLMLEILVS